MKSSQFTENFKDTPKRTNEYVLATLSLLHNHRLSIKNADSYLHQHIQYIRKLYYLLRLLASQELLNKKNCNIILNLIHNNGFFTAIYLLYLNRLLNQDRINLLASKPSYIPEITYAMTCLSTKKLLTAPHFLKLIVFAKQLTDINEKLAKSLTAEPVHKHLALTHENWNNWMRVEASKKICNKGFKDKKSNLHRFFVSKTTNTDYQHIKNNIYKFL